MSVSHRKIVEVSVHLSTRPKPYSILTFLALLVLLLTVPALAQPTAHANVRQSLVTSSSDWSIYGYNAQHTNFNPNETLINPTNVSKLVPKWTVSTEAYGRSTPIVSNGIVYTAYAPYLTAYSVNTGTQLWSVRVGFIGFSSTPLVANGAVYIDSLGALTAYNAKTGAMLWMTKMTRVANSQSASVFANGFVYEAWTSGFLYAYNATSGKIVWSANMGTVPYTSPTVYNNLVYIDSAYSVLAFNTFTGKRVWSFTTEGYLTSTATIANGVLYIGEADFIIYALNAVTGKKLWITSSHTHHQTIAIAAANGILYSYEGDLSAFNLKTGKHLWTAPIGIGVTPSPGIAVANGVIYAGSYDDNRHAKLYAFNASTGSRLWSYEVGQNEVYVPIVSNGTVYITSDKGTLTAFHLPGH